MLCIGMYGKGCSVLCCGLLKWSIVCCVSVCTERELCIVLQFIEMEHSVLCIGMYGKGVVYCIAVY